MADKILQIRNGGAPVITTVSSPRAPGATSLDCVALTNWPTATTIPFVTFKKKTNGMVDNNTIVSWKGSVSGNTIGSLELQNGTDVGNVASDFVAIAPTSAWAEGIYDWATTEHNTDGTHSNITATNITATNIAATGTFTAPASSISASTFQGARGSLGYAQKTTNTAVSTTPATLISIPNVTVGSGRLVELWATVQAISGSGGVAFRDIYRDSTLVGEAYLDIVSGGSQSGGTIVFYDTPSAGTYTYSFKISTDTGTGTVAATATTPTQLMVKDVGQA